MYVLIHLGNINNSERNIREGEEMCEKYQKGRQNIKMPNSGKQTRGRRKGGWRGAGVTG